MYLHLEDYSLSRSRYGFRGKPGGAIPIRGPTSAPSVLVSVVEYNAGFKWVYLAGSRKNSWVPSKLAALLDANMQ